MYKRNIITIAQIKPRAGFIEGNKNKIIDFIKKVSDKSDLIIFPDLALYGYHNFDMLKKFEIINSQIKEALFEIKKNVNSCVVLLNYPLKTGEIQNVLIENNEINYIKDVFELNNTKFQIIKNENDTLDDSVNYLIYLKNEITRQNSEYFKNKKLSALAQKYSKKLIYINQTGAFDELIYEGKSRVYDEKGNIICKLGAFKEDYEILDENLKGKIIEDIKNIEKTTNLDSFSLDYENDLERCYKTIVFAIKEYFNQNNFNKAVLGLSGGLDSTICATLLADALGKENVLGVLMPSKLTSSESNDDAATLARNLGINVIVAPIKTMQETLKEEFSENFKNIDSATSFKNSRYEKSYTQDNIQARLRAMILWGISNEYDKVLPIATSDKSEAYMGYATINGDMSGSYGPI